MEEYEVDAPVGAVVRWIREDTGRKTPRLLVRASKEYVVETDFDREEFGIGEDEDVELVSVHGVLEVQTRTGRKDWRLQLKIDDIVGLNPGDGETEYENEEEMSFEQFDDQFLSKGLGEVAITLAAENAEAKNRFYRWLARHMKGALENG